MQHVEFANRSFSRFEVGTLEDPGLNGYQRSVSSIDTSRYSEQRHNRINALNFRSKSTYIHLQNNSTSHEIKTKRSALKLIQMAFLFFGIEVLFSLETALTVPLLLRLRVPEKLFSIVYVLSPLLGVILQPILGLLSDRCTSRFGRRRPFIVVLSVGAFIGIVLILNGSRFGKYLGDDGEKMPIYGVTFTVMGVIFLDFFADSSDNPLKGFLLDVCNTEDQDTCLNIHAILGGIGASVGLVLAAVDWKRTFLMFIGDEFLILFTLSSVLFLTSLILTLVSVKEVPLRGIQNEETIRLLKIPEEIEDSNGDSNDDDRPVTVRLLLKSLNYIPKELLFLMITQFIGWQAYFSTMLFLTDFIGKTIYKGDPASIITSEEFVNYNKGVKMGCWCLLSGALFGSLYAFILEKFLLKKFSTRSLFFFGFFYYSVCQACVYFTSKIWLILMLCTSYGVLSVTLQTLPYQLLSEYHSHEMYRLKSPRGTCRGLGIDCALLSSCYFLSQTVVASYTSLLISVFGNYFIIIASCLCGFVGCVWISLFMIFPK